LSLGRDLFKNEDVFIGIWIFRLGLERNADRHEMFGLYCNFRDLDMKWGCGGMMHRA